MSALQPAKGRNAKQEFSCRKGMDGALQAGRGRIAQQCEGLC